MLGNRSWDEWIAQYSLSHQNRINQLCHLAGIPLIALCPGVLAVGLFFPGLWRVALGMFVLGWIFQFVGHAFERKAPEFFKDPRFILVGWRWWQAKIRGRA
jgi:uncharacterized membrane protein YGL010W